MWCQAFKSILGNTGSLAARLLRGEVHVTAPDGTLRHDLVTGASCVLATRPLRGNETRCLIIQRPDASPGGARAVTLAVVFAEVIGRLRPDPNIVRIRGDLLFVTQQIVQCRRLLESITLSTIGARVSLHDAYRIVPVTQPLPESGGGVLYLANPGRLSKLGRKEPFGAVIIDASHPRTLARLGSLLDAYPIAASPLRIILMPPRGREQILLDAKTWLWDPKAIADLHLVLDGEVQPVQLPTRHYWLSTEADIENQLHEVHRSLAGAMKLVRGVIPALLLGAWQVYHRFRQMAVPLAYVERARRRLPYVDPLATEIDRIKKTDPQASGDLKVYLDLHWPQIASGLDRLYSLFSDRMEPVKFWVTAQAVDAQFKQSDIPLRVVAGTSEEASLLAELLHDVVDDFGVRFRTGKVQVVHQGGEAKTILHEGHKETVLLGARTSHYRYLDLFHPQPVHVVAYRYEATVDRIVHGRLYDETNSLGTEEH